MNRVKTIRGFYPAASLGFILWIAAAGFTYAASGRSITADQYSNNVRSALDILETAEKKSVFLSARDIFRLRKIFPAEQSVIVGNREIIVKNKWLLDSFDTLDEKKDPEYFKQQSAKIKRKLLLLLEETGQPGYQFNRDPGTVIAGILERKEFSVRKLNPFLQKIRDWIENRVEQALESVRIFFSKLFEKINSFLERSLGPFRYKGYKNLGQNLNKYFTVSLYVIIAVSALLLLVFFIKYKWHRYLLAFFNLRKPEVDPADKEVPAGMHNWQVLKGYAEQALKNGDIRSAFHYSYLSLLLYFEYHRVLIYNESFTNREYVKQLNNYPEVSSLFRRLTDSFEQVWYGYKHIDSRDYDEFIIGYNKIVGDIGPAR